MTDHQSTGVRMIRLLAIARGLEDEGQYNVAKLFRATAWGEGTRATLERPRPNSGLYEARDAAMASAVAVRSSSRPISFELAAAAPNVPSVAVGCQPLV